LFDLYAAVFITTAEVALSYFHAELVSASHAVRGETLKQVQGDAGVEQGDAKGLGIRDSLFGIRRCGTAAPGCEVSCPK